jgi:heme/copper-type cytochrome/quinol oxidase subunit 3
MASGVTMVRARRAAGRDDQVSLRRGLAITGVLGLLFLAVQGSEWARLIHHGLTLSSGMYGATFYTLIGTHAAHVVGAVVWLAIVWAWAGRARCAGGRDAAVDACTIYWIFVCGLWIVLFGLVYQ